MLSKEDLVFHKALMKVLDDATYPLKAREVKSFLAIYDWASRLPQTVEALCQKEKTIKVDEAEVSKSERKRRRSK